MDKSEIIQRGQRAQLILDDELVKEAFARLNSTIIDQWCDLPVDDKAQAEELKRLMFAAKLFKNVFDSMIFDANVEKNELLMASNMQIKAEAARERVRNYG